MTGQFQSCRLKEEVTQIHRLRVILLTYSGNILNIGTRAFLIAFLALGPITILFVLAAVLYRFFSVILLILVVEILLLPAVVLMLSVGLAFPVSLNRQYRIWTLERKGKLIASVILKCEHDSSFLFWIKVVRPLRRRGFATYLFQRICLRVPQPIYTFSNHKFADFCRKIGFRSLPVEDVPQRFKAVAEDVIVWDAQCEKANTSLRF